MSKIRSFCTLLLLSALAATAGADGPGYSTMTRLLGGATPIGGICANKQVLYDDAGFVGCEAAYTYDKALDKLTVNTIASAALDLGAAGDTTGATITGLSTTGPLTVTSNTATTGSAIGLRLKVAGNLVAGDTLLTLDDGNSAGLFKVGGTGTTTATGFVTTRQTTSVVAHAFTCDFTLGAWCAVTLAGTSDDTMTLTGGVTGGKYTIELIQPGGGLDGTIAWASGTPVLHWPSAVAPVLSTTDGNVDIITCIYNGTSYFCGSALNFAP